MKAIGLIAIVVAAVAFVGLGTASGASGSAAHAAAVSTAKTGLGKIIVNSRRAPAVHVPAGHQARADER